MSIHVMTYRAYRLRESYGADPQEVGAEEGTEDDYGDLLSETYALLGGNDADDLLWQHFQDVAIASRCTDWDSWLAELSAALTIYGTNK